MTRTSDTRVARRAWVAPFLLAALTLTAHAADAAAPSLQAPPAAGAPEYTLAFASFAPLNTDIFLASGDGGAAAPFLPHPALDYNAAISADAEWIVFTSERDGSADIYRARADGSGLERIVDHPAFDDQAALSPDGRRLAFVSSRTGNADIWILDLETGVLRNLTDHPAGDFRPAWSPDGEWIAFSSDRDSTKPFVVFHRLQSTEIYRVRADGVGLARVTTEGGVAGTPAWSGPDTILFYQAPIGEAQALSARFNPGGVTQIMEANVASGAVRALTSGGGPKLFPQPVVGGVAYYDRAEGGGLRIADGRAAVPGEFQNPRWSPDGARMVFHREVETAWPPFQPAYSREPGFRLVRAGMFPSYSPDGAQIVMNNSPVGRGRQSVLQMRAQDGAGRTLLFDDPQKSAVAPAWSPDGTRIAFGLGEFFPMLAAEARADIAVLDVASGDVETLTSGDENFGYPSWSPDGRQLVYRAWRDQDSALLLIDLETRESRTLLTNFGRLNFPAWSPRGDRILFTSDRSGNYDLYTIDLSTAEVTQLTGFPDNDAHAAWSPDGEWIAFTSVREGFKDEALLTPGNPQGSGDLFIMRPDGSDVRILADTPFEEGTPAWAPLAP